MHVSIRNVCFICCSVATLLVLRSGVAADNVIPLWVDGAPGFENRKDELELAQSYWFKNIHYPTVTAFLPPTEKATGAAVVICPGGGHRELVFNAEGVQAAEYLNSIGVAAFALKYRLGREENSPYQIETHALQDGQRAVQLVRSRADEWGVDTTRIGMLGFSAGGEVVSMVAYSKDIADVTSSDPIARASSHPDFQMLVYPGPLGIPETLPQDAPPGFLLVANDDTGASRNVVDLIPKFRAAGIPLEVHLYARGGHAFNMGRRSKLRSLNRWPERIHDWMADNFLLDVEGRDEYQEQLIQQRNQALRNRARARERDNSPTTNSESP